MKRREFRQGAIIFNQGDPREALAYIHTLIRRLRSNNVKILVEGGQT